MSDRTTRMILKPLKAVVRATGIATRIAMGVIGFVLLCSGAFLITPMNQPVWGAAALLLGLLLTIKAIF